ncbi:MAG TPA: ABC transporter substrate-binding protein [Methanospirillum sp.]|nr:ABC transporter substrate-binding protein [Methanospirillum sp.]
MKDTEWALVTAVVLIIIIGIALPLYPSHLDESNSTFQPEVRLLYTSSGTVLQLLDSEQIDGFLIWEPVPQIAVLGDVGKIIATDADLPPDHSWAEEPCCVLVIHKDLIKQHPDLAAALSALTSAGIEYITKERESAVHESAAWLYGEQKIIIGDATLDPVSIETASFQEFQFISGENASAREDSKSPIILKGLAILNGSLPFSSQEDLIQIDFGYLPTDHHAPLFVLLNRWQYFQDRYDIALIPTDTGSKRHTEASLVVGGHILAKVRLLPGQNGGGLMTGIGQGVIDAAYVGSVPAQYQIDLGNPACIVQPIHTGGSAIVVGTKAPCNDWRSCILWAQKRSAEGNPLVIATVQTSIQEKMLRGACKAEGVEVRLLEI